MSAEKNRSAKELPLRHRAEIKQRLADLFAALVEIDPNRPINNVVIAADLGVAKSAITNWTKPHSPDIPRLANLIDICQTYDVTLDWLVFGHRKTATVDADIMVAINRAAAKRRDAERAEAIRNRSQRKPG